MNLRRLVSTVRRVFEWCCRAVAKKLPPGRLRWSQCRLMPTLIRHKHPNTYCPQRTMYAWCGIFWLTAIASLGTPTTKAWSKSRPEYRMMSAGYRLTMLYYKHLSWSCPLRNTPFVHCAQWNRHVAVCDFDMPLLHSTIFLSAHKRHSRFLFLHFQKVPSQTQSADVNSAIKSYLDLHYVCTTACNLATSRDSSMTKWHTLHPSLLQFADVCITPIHHISPAEWYFRIVIMHHELNSWLIWANTAADAAIYTTPVTNV